MATLTVEERLDALESENTALKEQQANLASAHTTLQQENEALKEQHTALHASNKELSQQIEKLSKATTTGKAEPEPKPTVPIKTFTVDGKEYKFLVARFKYQGQTMTATDALTDKDVLSHLVRTNSGIIQQVV